MSILARSAVSLRQVAVRSRAAPSRSMHGEYKHLPFEYKNKGAFGTKLAVYMLSGFILPFVAAGYQLNKSAAS
ncbi:hypothetical protein A0H81_08286 [Grifola frondosa]|uniref:Cytochrome c oxidase subunit 8, mitochondrial n=1 Tax=Grifola frondosa TaxID=5627 RepID=A0A1C7MA86_GRIFR|nr:hypothetical protein A0H81_08286 [Grifola frondosa]